LWTSNSNAGALPTRATAAAAAGLWALAGLLAAAVGAIIAPASAIGASAAANFFVLSLGVLIVCHLVDLVC
jgi:hypothetical protein